MIGIHTTCSFCKQLAIAYATAIDYRDSRTQPSLKRTRVAIKAAAFFDQQARSLEGKYRVTYLCSTRDICFKLFGDRHGSKSQYGFAQRLMLLLNGIQRELFEALSMIRQEENVREDIVDRFARLRSFAAKTWFNAACRQYFKDGRPRYDVQEKETLINGLDFDQDGRLIYDPHLYILM